jgi:CDP-diacylglycerol pyrophosphatase
MPMTTLREAGGLSSGAQFAGFALALAAGLTFAPVFAWADPSALWRIVHGACVPRAEAGQGPRPCESVDLAGGVTEGVAILKDLVGVAQMLAIPTRRISGIEDPQMLAPDAPPVFADGWKAKALVEARLNHPLPREAVALALNSQWARSQDQLHVHVDCVSKPVAAALADYGPALDENWRAMTVPLAGRVYFARRLDSADLGDGAPIRLLAERL